MYSIVVEGAFEARWMVRIGFEYFEQTIKQKGRAPSLRKAAAVKKIMN